MLIEKTAITIGREAFKRYLEDNCQDGALLELADELGISVLNLKRQYLYPYTKRNLSPKPTDKEMLRYETAQANKIKILNNNEDVNFINELLSFKYAKELLDFIANSEYSLDEIFNKINRYTRLNPEKEVKVKLLLIKKVIKKHQEEPILKIKMDQSLAAVKGLELLGITKRIIEQFLEGNKSFEEVMNEHQNLITINEFDFYLEKMINGTEEEYKLIEKLSQKLENDHQLFEEALNQIIQKLRKDQIETFAGTSFTILDYYRITNIPPTDFILEAKKIYEKGGLNEEDYGLLIEFITKYELGNMLITETQMIDYSYAYDGILLDLETREKIIGYLKSISVPLTINTYKQAYQDFIQDKVVSDLPLAKAA